MDFQLLFQQTFTNVHYFNEVSVTLNVFGSICVFSYSLLVSHAIYPKEHELLHQAYKMTSGKSSSNPNKQKCSNSWINKNVQRHVKYSSFEVGRCITSFPWSFLKVSITKVCDVFQDRNVVGVKRDISADSLPPYCSGVITSLESTGWSWLVNKFTLEILNFSREIFVNMSLPTGGITS